MHVVLAQITLKRVHITDLTKAQGTQPTCSQTPSQGVHVFYSFRNAYMRYMLPLYCRIDLAVEHCYWHSNARATTQRIAAPPSSIFVAACF